MGIIMIRAVIEGWSVIGNQTRGCFNFAEAILAGDRYNW